TAGHQYTVDALRLPIEGIEVPPVEAWTYRALFESTQLPRGTWIFCDIERLAAWELRLAAEVANLLRRSGDGGRLLNDPVDAASRYELLLRLHEAGLNSFRAWRAEDGVPPARFPVFVRLESNHLWP